MLCPRTSPGCGITGTSSPCSCRRAAAPRRHCPRLPIGPNVQESSGRLSQMATFQDLLASPHDEDLFQHFATGQLARIDTETGQVERIGPAALITGVDPSPDEKYLLVSTVRRPFSYRVPYVYFTRKTEVWDASGRPVATPADLPISDDIPRQGVPTGPRDVQWQPLHDARLLWAEALDGGDPRTKVPHRDKIMALDAPFTGKTHRGDEGPASLFRLRVAPGKRSRSCSASSTATVAGGPRPWST